MTIIERMKQEGSELAADIMNPILESSGRCPTCDKQANFVARNAWLRDHYLCSNCGSIPRERALMSTIETYFSKLAKLDNTRVLTW